MTLLNKQKSCEQKVQEVNHMADKWEKGVSVQNSEVTHSACPVDEVSEHSIIHITPVSLTYGSMEEQHFVFCVL